ncbi:hypothetical protein [Epiphyas postvittana nucleopolyhedrovirus]|uniref:Uncharacterized protein n=1 Tax=Epiphyas postvittana nucleopolyhedrovirus TaxID=70600 RepID=Q91GN9_NPVEP|nr:hypothetical protein [Epiphyas postvittana nucleopolyhedrovirus]AAK85572.1 unknown [Epiphyas postvittana nucleopolyhedrovirus]
MSLSSKLLVYDYYGNSMCGVNEQYGASYHLYKIVDEHITNSYVGDVPWMHREIDTARQILSGALCVNDACHMLDLDNTKERLATWYKCGNTKGVCHEVYVVLKAIDALVPIDKRSGGQFVDVDTFDTILLNITNKLPEVLHQYLRFVYYQKLEHVTDVFNPKSDTVGWWYNKFCVLTYMYRIINKSVPAELLTRLQKAVVEYIQPNAGDKYNCAEVMANVYGRFCGIGKQHFAEHKTANMHIMFKSMRGQTTMVDERYKSFSVIKDFSRHCKETYLDLKSHVDSLYINCTTDKQKNAMFDLLCCQSEQDLDVDCYDYIVNMLFFK